MNKLYRNKKRIQKVLFVLMIMMVIAFYVLTTTDPLQVSVPHQSF